MAAFEPIRKNRSRLGLFILSLVIYLLVAGCSIYRGQMEFQKGLQLFRAGEYSEAQRYALSAHRKAPNTAAYTGLLAWTNLKQDNIDEAERLFTHLYRKDKGDVAALQGLAWVRYTQNRYKEARVWFGKQLAWAKGHANNGDWHYYPPADRKYVLSVLSDAYYGLGLTSLALGDASRAQGNLREALGYPNDFIGHGPIKESLGDVLYVEGKYPLAASQYREALAGRKDTALAVKLGWALQYSGKSREAERLFRENLEGAKDQRPLLYGMAFAAHSQGKTAEAEDFLRSLINRDPYFADTKEVAKIIDDMDAWPALGKDFARAYFKRGDFKRALPKIENYISQVGSDCEARIMEAWCRLYSGRLKTSLKLFSGLSKNRNCDRSEAFTGRGVALLYLGRLTESRTAFLTALKFNADNTRAKVALGAVAYLEGDFEKAIKIYTTHLHLLPERDPFFSWPSHALNNLGWSYIQTGHYEKAVKTFMRLKAYHPRPIYPSVFNGLGWAYLHMGKIQEARKAFEHAVTLDATNSLARKGLAAAGDYDKGAGGNRRGR